METKDEDDIIKDFNQLIANVVQIKNKFEDQVEKINKSSQTILNQISNPNVNQAQSTISISQPSISNMQVDEPQFINNSNNKISNLKILKQEENENQINDNKFKNIESSEQESKDHNILSNNNNIDINLNKYDKYKDSNFEDITNNAKKVLKSTQTFNTRSKKQEKIKNKVKIDDNDNNENLNHKINNEKKQSIIKNTLFDEKEKNISNNNQIKINISQNLNNSKNYNSENENNNINDNISYDLADKFVNLKNTKDNSLFNFKNVNNCDDKLKSNKSINDRISKLSNIKITSKSRKQNSLQNIKENNFNNNIVSNSQINSSQNSNINLQQNQSNINELSNQSPFDKFFNFDSKITSNETINESKTNEQNKIQVKTEVDCCIINQNEVERYNFKGSLYRISSNKYVEHLEQIENQTNYIFNEQRLENDNEKKKQVKEIAKSGNNYFIYKQINKNNEINYIAESNDIDQTQLFELAFFDLKTNQLKDFYHSIYKQENESWTNQGLIQTKFQICLKIDDIPQNLAITLKFDTSLQQKEADVADSQQEKSQGWLQQFDLIENMDPVDDQLNVKIVKCECPETGKDQQKRYFNWLVQNKTSSQFQVKSQELILENEIQIIIKHNNLRFQSVNKNKIKSFQLEKEK